MTLLPADPSTRQLSVLIIGATVGFLSGLLGKGGSAIATPALQIFAGVAPFAALASPLPASLPATLSAAFAYRKKRLVNGRLVLISTLTGTPATLIGSFCSSRVSGQTLMILTAVFVIGLGLSFFLIPGGTAAEEAADTTSAGRIMLVAASVGLLAGLLANSGGILFAPLFIRFLKLPTKQALASSLVVSATLAIPGTIAHWRLGHIDWSIALLLSLSTIPCSYLGARVALWLKNEVLEKIFAFMLIVFGAFDLFHLLH